MATRTIANKTLDVDAEGFLTNHKDWDLEVAKVLAAEEGIATLTEFETKGDGPSIRKLTKESGVPTKELYELFPGGPAKKAAKIAGIKKPHGCI
jgi:dissimilatory sulfite reductase related protein